MKPQPEKGRMGREDDDIRVAKLGYKDSARDGNHEDEARWANVIGDILKRRGEYVEALRWLRIDYELSAKYLPQKQLLATCQSLGEVYLRLERFKEALLYQKKHFELANDSKDIIEQQRASTQLGRTYHEMFLRSENDHYAVRNSKKYFKLAMKLARSIKENPPSTTCFFLKEYIDAHNNIGMLEMDLDNLEEAEKTLLEGLKMCDEEEVKEDDDGRSRLNHNLGSVYLELREWSKAREHIVKDILICKRIEHTQGEAKGFINLGELHYRVQKYDDAIPCYQKALDIAKSMEDEDSLVDQISQNIKTVKEAAKVLETLKKDEQKLKKLMRATSDARGTSNERKRLTEQNVCLDSLIEKCSTIFAWPKHQEFAKRKKRVAAELCDKEKLSDSFLVIGESYQKLRNFGKARKWYMKSWNIYRSIGNAEGQALVKINIGEVLDSSGDWAGALEAFEEGYRIAVKGNLTSVQLSALDNMHYSHMIRFDNVNEARKLQIEIQNVKRLLNEDDLFRKWGQDYCSETETETEGVDASNPKPDECDSLEITNPSTVEVKADIFTGDELDDDVPLRVLVQKCKKSSNKEMSSLKTKQKPVNSLGVGSSCDLTNYCGNQQSLGRKRVRVVISDGEDSEPDWADQPGKRICGSSFEDVATSCGDTRPNELAGVSKGQDTVHCSASKNILGVPTPTQIEESACSFKSKSSRSIADDVTEFASSSNMRISNAPKFADCGSKVDVSDVSGVCVKVHDGTCFTPSIDNLGPIMFKVGHDSIHVDTNCCLRGNELDIEYLKVEVACACFLQLFPEKRFKGLVPVIHQLVCCGKVLDSPDAIVDVKTLLSQKVCIDIVISEWVPKRLMKLYMNFCDKSSEAPNHKLLKKLYDLEVSEDEIIVSDCALHDISILPFLHALEVHKTVALLDISHNSLGNETMEKIQQIFTSSNQKYGGLNLDLHCNRFGPTALFQICECSIMFTRLEVLNLSQNRLTEACSSYLSTILQNCKALYSLKIEQCSITSRTIQKITDSLHGGSILTQLWIGKNNPISGNAMVNLLSKLSSLKRFSELSLADIRLNKPAVEGLSQFARSSSLSALFLQGACIGADGAVKLTEALCSGPHELLKLDLSSCGITSDVFDNLCANLIQIDGIVELNLGGNFIGIEGYHALEHMLTDPQCSIKTLILDRCRLGLDGILRIVVALAGNESLEVLHLAGNANITNERADYHSTTDAAAASPRACNSNNACGELEVADSEDEEASKDVARKRNFSVSSQLIQELSVGIGAARQIQLLDLSNNDFSTEAIESLYLSWSSAKSRSGQVAYKHGKEDKILHFSVVGRRCCGIRNCCMRD